MGSFDMTCGVSNITVSCNSDKVKLFFIAENNLDCSRSKSPTYIWSNWNYVSFGIDAKYDDYGDYVFDENDEAFLGFINHIKNYAVKVEQGDNEYHDLPFDPSNPEHLTGEYIQTIIQKGRLKVTNSLGNECQIETFPVLKEVWDNIVLTDKTNFSTSITFKHKKDKIFKELEDRPTQKGLSGERLDTIISNLEAIEDKSEEIVNNIINLKLMKKYPEFEESNIPVSYLGIAFDEFASRYNFKNHLNRTGNEWLANASAELQFLSCTMMDNNIAINPVPYGGQDQNFKIIADFHTRCAEIAQEYQTKYDIDSY